MTRGQEQGRPGQFLLSYFLKQIGINSIMFSVVCKYLSKAIGHDFGFAFLERVDHHIEFVLIHTHPYTWLARFEFIGNSFGALTQRRFIDADVQTHPGVPFSVPKGFRLDVRNIGQRVMV